MPAASHHLPGVDAVEPFPRQLRLPTSVGTMLEGLEEGDLPKFAQPGPLDVSGEVAIERVVAGHLVELAALLALEARFCVSPPSRASPSLGED